MRLKVVGGTEDQRHHVSGIAKFCAKKLIDADIAKEIKVRISIVPMKDMDPCALCDWTDFEEDPRTFEITIAANPKTRLRNVLGSVAHEMVHVKQYATGELRDITDDAMIVFQKKKYSQDYPYWESPWEIEAAGRERGLVHEYAVSANIANVVIRSRFD